MSDSLAIKTSNLILNWSTAASVISLAVGGFTLSFSALRDLAIGSGIPTPLAFIWPLIVDGFIVVATASAFALRGRKRSFATTWYPWSALIVFSAISVTGNALHAFDNPDSLRVPVVIATCVSSVPAIALLVASHLFVVMVGGRVGKEREKRATRQLNQSVRATTPLASARVAPSKRTELNDGLAIQLRNAGITGTAVTATAIGEFLGASERTGRRRLVELKRTSPELFQTESTPERVFA